MNIADLFIRRPVTTTLVMLAILVFGVMSYRILPVSDLPNVDFPTISVSANLPGASAETMASTVATPLERQFATIAGIDSISSTNTLGTTRVTLQFALERSIDAAAQDVQSAIAKVQRQLPPDMSSPPSYQKVNPADSPIFYLTMSSATQPMSVVNEYADNVIAPRISMIGGVAQVSVYGAKKYAVRVQLDPKALAGRDVGLEEVADAIDRSTRQPAHGHLYGEFTAMNVQASGKLMDAAAFRPLIVTWRNGAPVRLHDLGEVVDSVENDKIASWRGDTRAIVLAVQRQPGTNTVEVVDTSASCCPPFPSRSGLHRAQGPLRRSESIRESVEDVKFTLLLTMGLVVGVIFIFLRNVRATLIPSMALPMSWSAPSPSCICAGTPWTICPHGPDPGRGVRGRRRHRHAREHRAPPGDGQARAPGGLRRVQGDLLHHPVHDHLPGRRVHSGAVHGRDRGPALPRVRGGHLRGHPHLGFVS
jgi:HAE1 family hydrophobic/amphiphilic exporter-1